MVTVGRANAAGIPVSAIIADLGAVDKEGDAYEPGAFRSCGSQSISQWGHSSIGDGQMPVGLGVIQEKGGMAIFTGILYREMQAAKDLAALLKRRGASQQWSYAYSVKDFSHGYRDGKSVRILKDVDAHEVSPVHVGAGVGTSTLSVGRTLMKLHAANWWDGDNRCGDCDDAYRVFQRARENALDWVMSR